MFIRFRSAKMEAQFAAKAPAENEAIYPGMEIINEKGDRAGSICRKLGPGNYEDTLRDILILPEGEIILAIL